MTAKLKIILVVITCLLLNSSAVFCNVELPVDLPAQTVAPAVFQLVSLVRLPFTIMAGIARETPLFPGYKLPSTQKPVPARETNKTEDSICTNNSVLWVRAGVGPDNNGRSLPVAVESAVPCSVMRAAMNSPDTCPLFIPVTLLIYLAILMASNLPWQGVLCPLEQARSRGRAAGLFHFSEMHHEQ